jgi:hypothetical protein
MTIKEREEIVKALECCSDCECYNAKAQEDCPLINVPFCKNYLRKQSLALIKELTDENEKLNERLDREAKCQYDLATKIVDLRDDIKYVKAETVRKMQEKIRAKSEYGTINISPWQLDQIAKEVLED